MKTIKIDIVANTRKLISMPKYFVIGINNFDVQKPVTELSMIAQLPPIALTLKGRSSPLRTNCAGAYIALVVPKIEITT